MRTFTILLIVICLGAFSVVYGQEYVKIYENGLCLKETGDVDGAIEMFKKAINLKYRFPDAHNELARCYILKGSVGYRKKAEFAVNHAIDMEWENTRYLHTLADLYRAKLMSHEMHTTYKRIIKLDPENLRAINELGKYYWDRYNYVNIKVSVSSEHVMLDSNLTRYKYGDVGPLSNTNNLRSPAEINSGTQFLIELSDFAEDEYNNAMRLYDSALRIDPDNREAHFFKGFLLFDNEEYEDFIEMFKEIAEKNDKDMDAFLFLGLGYAKIGEHTESSINYEKALTLMNPEEREMFENVDFIHPNFDIKRWREYKMEQNITIAGFWRGKDPLFLTEFNERRYEHLGRIAEANLRFYKPNFGVPGWKTDRGRIFIRYGKPNRMREYTKSPLGSSTSFTGGPKEFEDNAQKFQFWYYDDFTFVFSSFLTDYSNNFRLNVWNGLNFKEREIDVFSGQQEKYEYEPKGEMFDFPVEVLTFRGEENITDVKFYYDVPLNRVDIRRESGSWKGEVENGLFLFTNRWDEISREVDTAKMVIETAELDTSANSYFGINRSFSFGEGSYNYAVEMVDPASGNTGAIRDGLNITSYGYDSLRVSDLLLANSIEMDDPGNKPEIENLRITANPSHQFELDQDIYLYFEVYNLFEDLSLNRYRLDYILSPEKEKSSWIKDLIWRGAREEGTSVSTELNTTGRDDNNIIVISHNISKPGRYGLTVRITDLNTGSTVEKEIVVLLYENLP